MENDKHNNVFKPLSNLDNAHKLHKAITIAALIVMAVVSIASVIIVTDTLDKNSRIIYAIKNDGEVAVLEKSSVNENRAVEIVHHLNMFYHAFLDLDPDEKAILESTDKALWLGGDDVKNLRGFYIENNVYNNLIQNNTIMRCIVDSVTEVRTNVYPYTAKVYGKQILERKSSREIRSYNSIVQLVNLNKRTLNNPHALFIRRFTVTSNKIIKRSAK
jgi:hypothetical protein